MQQSLRNTFSILILAAVVMAVAGGCAEKKVSSGGEFDAAFRETGLPWHDSETNDLVASKAPPRPSSSVSDRNRIPPATPKVGRAVKREPIITGTGGAGQAVSSATSSFIFIVGGILAAIIVGLLLYGFFKLESAKDEQSKTKPRRKIRDHIKHLPFEIEDQDGDFETFADRSLREGDYNRAIIYLFADVLVAMNESGVVRLQKGKTNRQYLNDIWDYETIKPFYRKIMIAFEDVFFGKHQIEKERTEDCFAGRANFDVELEKIRSAKFSSQTDSTSQSPTISAPPLQMNTAG